MYNKFATFDDLTIFIDDEEGFVKIVKNSDGFIAANLENGVKSLEQSISKEKRKINLLNKKRVLQGIKNMESHLNFFKTRLDEEESKLDSDYALLQDFGKVKELINDKIRN